ncbi:MAG TPA: hypothetical protein VEK82_06380 [Stellaceae bacterium]|nr:hypothetical protein [Stellaceae bacterium]
MPYLTSLSIRISRKFQIEKDDWVGVDALATVAVEEAEAHLVDPADIRRLAREQAKAAVREQIADEIAERDEQRRQRAERRRQRAAQAQAVGGDHVAPQDSAPAYQPPRDPAEAEQRFFARYGEAVGGEDWNAVQKYLRSRAPKPATVEGWIAAAEAVRDQARTASNGRH